MKPLKMCPNQTSGFLFTFCGLDGCGKTTMLKKLTAELERDHEIFLTKQPTPSMRSAEIFRTYMDTPRESASQSYDYRGLSLLAASDRVQHVNKVILPQMQDGKIVISDRYFYSCLANLRARGYSKDTWIYEIASHMIKPDLAFFFDVPAEIAIHRVRSREEEKTRYIDIALQYRLREEYRAICKANKGILISTEMSVDESYSIVKKHVERMIKHEHC